MSKMLTNVTQLSAIAVLGLASFGATAYAADSVAGSETSILDLLKPVYEAFRGGNYIAGAALAVVLTVAMLRRYAPGRIGKFMNSDVGGTLSAFLVAGAGSVAAASPDASWSWSILKTAGSIAVAAAGGYTVIKKLLVDRLTASNWYNTKAPAWLKMALRVVLWVFDKPAANADVIAAAEQAGKDAVVAKPSAGADGVVGPAEKF
jgi:hypothetical protein